MTEGPGRNPKITGEEIIEVFRSYPYPVMTTSEVASNFDLTDRGIRDRIEGLEDAGRLKSKKVGARAKVWWKPEE